MERSSSGVESTRAGVTMSKKFQLVHPNMDCASVGPSNTNWELCATCQEDAAESIVRPATSKRLNIESGYKRLAGNLIQFGELGLLPRTLQLDRLDEGEGIEPALVAHKAIYHKECMLHFNATSCKEQRGGQQEAVYLVMAMPCQESAAGHAAQNQVPLVNPLASSVEYLLWTPYMNPPPSRPISVCGSVQHELETTNCWHGSAWVMCGLLMPSIVPSV